MSQSAPRREIADPATEVMVDPEGGAEPSAAGREAAVDPEANAVLGETRKLRPGEVVARPALPFVRPETQGRRPQLPQAGAVPPAVAPTSDELDELVWRSKVGIDPEALPSSQLVIPPAVVPVDRSARSKGGFGSVLLVLLLLTALAAGFAVMALALGG